MHGTAVKNCIVLNMLFRYNTLFTYTRILLTTGITLSVIIGPYENQQVSLCVRLQCVLIRFQISNILFIRLSFGAHSLLTVAPIFWLKTTGLVDLSSRAI